MCHPEIKPVSPPAVRKRTVKPRWKVAWACLAGLALLAAANAVVAYVLLLVPVERIADRLARGEWPVNHDHWNVALQRVDDADAGRDRFSLDLTRAGADHRLQIELPRTLGEQVILLRWGENDGARVIRLRGSPYAIGHQHGTLLRDNLHNVIFEPQHLRLHVADATRARPACDQPYREYTWDELFSSGPPL